MENNTNLDPDSAATAAGSTRLWLSPRTRWVTLTEFIEYRPCCFLIRVACARRGQRIYV